jgi:hypothetical protein
MAEAIFDLYSFLMGGLSSPVVDTLPYEPLEFPTDIPTVSGVKSITFYSDFVMQTSESPWTYQRQTFTSTGDRWRATVELPSMTRAQAGQWQGMLLNLQGGYNSFLFGDVFNRVAMGSLAGAPRVKGADQSGRILETDGWDASEWGVLLAGDRIQLGTRLYQVTRNVNSDSSGNATLNIFPSLREAPVDNSLLTLEDCVGVFTLASPVNMLSKIDSRGIYQGLTFDVVEVI